jgi:hypothetical protein
MSGLFFGNGPLDGALHEFACVPEGQFVLDVGLIRLNGLDTDVQRLGNFASRVSFTDQPEYFEFAIG